MSGICGFVRKSDEVQSLNEIIAKMNQSLTHRGPDKEVSYVNKNVGFGARVLNIFKNVSIKYPITNEDKSLFLFIDGEIYNYQALREDLEKKGHKFSGSSDVEVIIHLYEDFGEECVNYLRGIFAFAIWDSNKKKLLLYRDHLGIKPLFYTLYGDIFLFGTEIKAIFQFDRVKKELNYNALDHFFNFRFIPDPETIFKNIHKLPAGCYLSLTNGEFEIKQYWDYNFADNNVKSDGEYEERLLELLTESIKLRMMGRNFSFGSFLSGGMDSSSVVCLLSEMLDKPLPTFSIAFEEKDYDESYYQRVVAKHCKTDHHEFIVKPESVEELLSKLVGFFDQPFGDSSALPSYYLAKMTRQHVASVYTGDGGDELLAGYTTYPGMLHSEKYRKLPGVLSRALIPGMVSLVGAILPRKFTYDVQRVKKIIGDAVLPLEDRYFQKIAIARKEERYRLYNDDTINQIARGNENQFYHYFEKTIGKHLIHRVNYIDAKFRFTSSVLAKTEQTCAANSLLIRPPYLDHKLVEFGASVPPRLKVKGFQTKYLLHRVMNKKLPREIHVKQKHGFEPPLTIWFKDDLKPFIKQTLLSSDSRIANYFKKDELNSIIETHVAGKKNLGEHLWGLLMFEVWHRLYIG